MIEKLRGLFLCKTPHFTRRNQVKKLGIFAAFLVAAIIALSPLIARASYLVADRETINIYVLKVDKNSSPKAQNIFAYRINELGGISNLSNNREKNLDLFKKQMCNIQDLRNWTCALSSSSTNFFSMKNGVYQTSYNQAQEQMGRPHYKYVSRNQYYQTKCFGEKQNLGFLKCIVSYLYRR